MFVATVSVEVTAFNSRTRTQFCAMYYGFIVQ